jgi:hypothetical protein
VQVHQPIVEAVNEMGAARPPWAGVEKRCRGRLVVTPSKKRKTDRQDSDSSRQHEWSAPPQRAPADAWQPHCTQPVHCESSRLLALLDVACEDPDSLLDCSGECQELGQGLIDVGKHKALYPDVVEPTLPFEVPYMRGKGESSSLLVPPPTDSGYDVIGKADTDMHGAHKGGRSFSQQDQTSSGKEKAHVGVMETEGVAIRSGDDDMHVDSENPDCRSHVESAYPLSGLHKTVSLYAMRDRLPFSTCSSLFHRHPKQESMTPCVCLQVHNHHRCLLITSRLVHSPLRAAPATSRRA